MNRDPGDIEAERHLAATKKFLADKDPIVWFVVAMEDGHHDEYGVREWVRQQPQYAEAKRQVAAGAEPCWPPNFKSWLNTSVYDYYRDTYGLVKDHPRPGSPEFDEWWKTVRGDPEKYWANEPVMGYPKTITGKIARYAFAALMIAFIVWMCVLYVGIKS